jgi:hypothetical protein
MSKHTPGPWKVIAVDWSETGNARFEINGISRTGIADARLIASAPDLLDALIALRERHQIDDPHHAQLCEFCKQADAAISKATGAAA